MNLKVDVLYMCVVGEDFLLREKQLKSCVLWKAHSHPANRG